MKYYPGGYTWLNIAPESTFELEIEKLEEQIHFLKKQYADNKDQQFLEQAHLIQEEIYKRKQELKNL